MRPEHRRVVRSLEPVLRFEGVTRRHPDGERQVAVLDDVSFTVREGAVLGLFGTRRSGKSTLLRLAAGIELPDKGVVRFAGRSLSDMSQVERERLLRGTIALLCPQEWRPKAGERVIDHVALTLASGGATVSDARRRARQALADVAMADRCEQPAEALSLGERVRAMLAGAMAHDPSLLLVDEPALTSSAAERDEIGALLRTIAQERHATLMIASEELAALHGASVLMSISHGELCSTDESRQPHEPGEPGVVIRLPKRSATTRRRTPL